MYITLHDVIAPNGMDKLPMLPDNIVAFGKKRKTKRKVKKKQQFDDHLVSMLRIVKLKKPKVVNKKVMSSLLSKINRKIQTDLKRNKSKFTIRMIRHCLHYYNMKLTSLKSKTEIRKKWSQLMRKHRTSIRLFKFKEKKRKISTKKVGKKAESYITHGKKGPRKSPKYKISKFGSSSKYNNRFGSYWDNTQLTYGLGCATQQCGGTTGGQVYPYEGNFRPYYPIGRNAFGGLNLDKIEKRLELSLKECSSVAEKCEKLKGKDIDCWLEYPNIKRELIKCANRRKSRHSLTPNKYKFGNIPMGQGVSRNYCENGMQCGSFPLSVERAYPFTVDTRFRKKFK